MHEGGGTVWNTSKRGGTKESCGDTKTLKKVGEAGSKDGCLKGGGGVAGTPLRTMNRSLRHSYDKRFPRLIVKKINNDI